MPFSIRFVQRPGRMPASGAAALILGCLLSGCAALFNPTLQEIARAQRDAARPVSPQEGIGLEVFFVERTPGDPLTGDSLWGQLDQIAGVDPQTRRRLNENGFRFGISGTTLPWALQGLISNPEHQGPGRCISRQTYQTPSGVTHEFPCGALPNPVLLRLHTDDGLQEREYVNARGVLRCRVEYTQPGWATLEVLPVIQSGERKLRPVPTDEKWEWEARQLVEPLYAQRFKVSLNEGEVLVLGAVGDQIDAPGARFFRTGQDAQPVEKLLVIRLTSIEQVAPVLQTGK